MRHWRLVIGLLAAWGAVATAASAQTAPPEWRSAAVVLFARLDAIGAPPGTTARAVGPEIAAGYRLARRWRQHNNGNTENILAEFLAFVQLCRSPGCNGDAVAGKGYLAWAQEVRAERGRHASADALVQAIHAWLERIAPAAGADAGRNLALVRKDIDQAASDFATTNIYALGWLVARTRPDPATQAAAFARFILFVYGQAWIGDQCIDIRRIAAVLDGPPQIGTCR